MRRGLAIATLVLLCCVRDACAEDGRAEQALHPGVMGIEVGVNTFDLGTPSSGVLAVRRQFSQGWGARLSVGYGNSHSDGNTADFQDGEILFGTTERESHRVDLGAQVVWFPVRAGNCALSFAAGPGYFDAKNREDSEDIPNQPSVYRRTQANESTGHGFTASLDAGFDWFLDRRVALRARSGTAFTWTHGSSGYLLSEYDVSGNLLRQFGRGQETDGTGFSTLTFGLSLIGYF